MKDPSIRLTLLLLLLSAIVAVAFQGSRGLYDRTEGRYAEIAREMIERDDYLTPTLDYRPHWSKPPAAYWAIAAGLRLAGRSAWGARLPNALWFVLTVLAVARIGRRLWGEPTGWVAGAVYATSPFPVIAANAVTTDTLLALWEVCLVLAYVEAAFGDAPRRRQGWITAMWGFAGLGFLTKGPVALLPLVAIALWHARHHRLGDRIRLLQPLGLVLFLVVGCSWYGLIAWRQPEVLSYWVRHEVIGRAATAEFDRNPEWFAPLVIYLPLLLAGGGFWAYFAAKALERNQAWKPRSIRRTFGEGGPAGFVFLWVIVPLGILFAVRSRLPLYVLPLYAPVALLTARGMVRISRPEGLERRVLILASIAALVLVGVKGGSAYLFPSRHDMGALYRLCRPLDRNADWYAFCEKRLFGLQFYLDGRLKRVSTTGSEPWVDASVGQALSGNESAPQGRPCMFLSSVKHSAELKQYLDEHGLGYSTVKDGYWILFRVNGTRQGRGPREGLSGRVARVGQAERASVSCQEDKLQTPK